MDVCACLITLLQDHPDLSSLILELGFVSKLRDNLEASHATPAVYELSLLVLCAILRGNSILHRTVVLKVGHRHSAGHNCNSLSHSGTSTGSSSAAAAQPTRAPTSVLNNSIFPPTSNGIFDYNATSFGTGMFDSSNSYGGGFFNYAPPVEVAAFLKPTSYQPGEYVPNSTMYVDVYTVKLFSLIAAARYEPFLSNFFLPSLIFHFSSQLGNVLTHIIYHLCRTENNLTKSDLCRALVCTMDFGGSCANDCFDFGLLGALQGVLLVGSHDLTVDAGMCVLISRGYFNVFVYY